MFQKILVLSSIMVLLVSNCFGNEFSACNCSNNQRFSNITRQFKIRVTPDVVRPLIEIKPVAQSQNAVLPQIQVVGPAAQIVPVTQLQNAIEQR